MSICPVGKCATAEICQNLAICTSDIRCQISRNISHQKNANNQKTKDTQQEFTGIYMGYSFANNAHLVKVEGKILPVENVSNGYIAVGTKVPVLLYKNHAIITSMPSM